MFCKVKYSLLNLIKCKYSFIQLTVDRLKPICPVENMWVVTNEKYISIVREQIPDMPVDNILAEPEARNVSIR